jgi:hypothetical protein
MASGVSRKRKRKKKKRKRKRESAQKTTIDLGDWPAPG